MKKYLLVVSLIAVASTFAFLVSGTRNDEETIEETDDDVMTNSLGV